MKPVALALGAVSVIALLLNVDSGDLTVGDVVFLAILAAWCFSPWAALAFDRPRLVHPPRALAIGACAVVAIATFATIDDSSTGAIGLLFLPVLQWAIVGVAAIGGGVATRMRGRRSA